MTTQQHDQGHLIRSRILKMNLKRLSYLPLVAIPLNIGHIVWFFFALDGSDPTEYLWRLGLIWSHTAIMAIAVFLGIVSFLRLKNYWQNDRQTQWLTGIGIVLLILAGVTITVIDQLVTTAITPFLILSIVIAFLIHMPPWKALIMYLLAFGLLFFCLPLTQSDEIAMASGSVNALTAAGVGFFLSWVMWRNTWSAQQNEIIIDEQKHALEASNADLKRQAEELQESNATKDRLMSVIAHDLRSPFNSILGYTQLLQQKTNLEQFAPLKELVIPVEVSAAHTLQLLENLLGWALIQQQKIKCNPVQVNLHQLVSKSLQFVHNQARQKMIHFTHTISPSIRVMADITMVQSIIGNLANNAIKYTDPGGSVDVFAVDAGDNRVRISVSDNGMGMNSEKVQVLLSSLSAVESRPGTEHEPGTGLGLLICKEFAQLHGGQLEVESTPGEGSVFSFTLPLCTGFS